MLMQADVSQGELRIAAHMSDETTMINLFNSGVSDIHTSTAALIVGCNEDEVTEDQRHNGKTINFAVLFGSGARTTAQTMKGVTEGQAYQFIRAWHDTFPRWQKYVHEVEKFVIENHYVENLFHRRRHLFILDPTTPEGRTALRKAVNSPIQGGLSDYNKLCGVNVWKKLGKMKLSTQSGIKIIGEVHDSWIYDMKEKHVPMMAALIKEEFENVNTSDFGFKFKVPMKVDIKIGSNWKEMEDYAVH